MVIALFPDPDVIMGGGGGGANCAYGPHCIRVVDRQRFCSYGRHCVRVVDRQRFCSYGLHCIRVVDRQRFDHLGVITFVLWIGIVMTIRIRIRLSILMSIQIQIVPQSFTHVAEFFLLLFIACFIFLVSVIGVKFFNILYSILKFSGKSFVYLHICLKWIRIGRP
jgi:hypothetical protein